jgi:hypothetical protein
LHSWDVDDGSTARHLVELNVMMVNYGRNRFLIAPVMWNFLNADPVIRVWCGYSSCSRIIIATIDLLLLLQHVPDRLPHVKELWRRTASSAWLNDWQAGSSWRKTEESGAYS